MVTMTPSAVLRLQVETDPPAGKSKQLVPNSNGERGGYFYTSLGGEVDAEPTGLPRIRFQRNASSPSPTFRTYRMPVVPGQYVSARWRYELLSAGTATLNGRFEFEDSAGITISTSAASASTSPNPGVDVTLGPIVVPAGAANVRLLLTTTLVLTNYVEVSTVQVVCRASSAAVVWATDAVDTTWLDVTGPTIEIEVERASLDLGVLNATIRDATLDPLTVPTIRTGRDVRLQAKHALTGAWESVFEGELSDFEVEYEAAVLARNLGDPKHCRITLVGLDPTRLLASARRPNAPKDLPSLRDTIEDTGVAYNIDGSRKVLGVSPKPYVAYTDKATALDQVAVARDSYSGLAWVDRRGELQVWTRANLTPFGNPGFEVDTSQWTATTGTSFTRVASPTASGTGAGSITASGATITLDTAKTRAVPGHQYVVSVKTRAAAATGRQARVQLQFFDASNNLWSSVVGSYATVTTSGWTTSTVTAPCPTLARYVKASVVFNLTAAGEVYYVDDLRGLNAEVALDQSVWSRIEIGGGTKQVVNDVTIEFQRFIDDVTTETVLYGPYRDEASVGVYGTRSRKYTVNGNVNVAGEPALALSIAQGVLNANAYAKVAATSVTVPVRTAADLTLDRCLGDLGQLASVSFATKAYAADLRIASVRHRIKADPKRGVAWLVDYGFEQAQGVAAPRPVPPPGIGTGAAAKADTPWAALPLATGWGNYGSGLRNAEYRRYMGMVEIRGFITPVSGAGLTLANLPSGFRPAANENFASVNRDGTQQRVEIRPDGVLQTPDWGGTLNPGDWITVSGIRYEPDGA